MAVRAALTALLLLARGVPAIAGEAEPLQHVEGTLFQMNSLEEITDTQLGTFRLDSAGPGDLRETPGTAELTLFSGGTLRTFAGVAIEAREVDVRTGRPVASPGTGRCDPDGLFGPPDVSGCLLVGANGPQNRQLFDDICSATAGVATAVSEFLAARCLLDVVNDTTINLLSAGSPSPIPITDPQTQATFSGFFSNLFVGNPLAVGFAGLLAPGATYIALNQDPGDFMPANCEDGPVGLRVNCAYAATLVNDGTDPIQNLTLNQVLTPQQQALLGCGPFYGSNCEVDGIDLFNAEGSVLVQSFPQIEPDLAAATRVNPFTGQVVVLPGARGPTDPDYDPRVDGCTGPDDPSIVGDEACALSNGGAGANSLLNPLTGERFSNELDALSWNFMLFLASLSLPDPGCATNPPGPYCDPAQGDPDCELTTAEGLIACGVQRSTLAFLTRELNDDPSGPPQRRWLWESGAEYLQTDEATGDLAGLETWTFHAVGPEVPRRDNSDEAGVLFVLGPPDEVMIPPDSPLVVQGLPGFVGLAYGVVPEPSQVMLHVAALLAAVGLARSRRRL
jgi:hypothetical protein